MRSLFILFLSFGTLLSLESCAICECGDRQPEEDWDNIRLKFKMDSLTGFAASDLDSFFLKKFSIGDSIHALDSTMNINLNFDGNYYLNSPACAIPYDYPVLGEFDFQNFDYILGSQSPYFRFHFTDIVTDGKTGPKPCKCYSNTSLNFKLNGVSHSKADLPLELTP